VKSKDYERMILNAKNEIGNLVLRLGGTCQRAVIATRKVEMNIRDKCDNLNNLIEQIKRYEQEAGK